MHKAFFPVAWLDNERLLMWVRRWDENGAPYMFLYEYGYRNDTFTPVCGKKGGHIPWVSGGDGFNGSYNPSTGLIVQQILWAEGFFNA